jgi:hypothetical protein
VVRFSTVVVEKPKNPSAGDVMCVCVCGGFERGPVVGDVLCVCVGFGRGEGGIMVHASRLWL